MALTPKQQSELAVAYQRVQAGVGSDADKSNIAYAQKQGWNPASPAPPMAPQTPALPSGMTQFKTPAEAKAGTVTGQVGQAGQPGSFLYGNPAKAASSGVAPGLPRAITGGTAGAAGGTPGAAGTAGTPAPGTGSNEAFNTIFSKVVNDARDQQYYMEQKAKILKHMFDEPLSEEEKSKLPQSVQDVLNSKNLLMAGFAVQLLNDQIKGRVDENMNSFSYMFQGYQADQQRLQDQQAAMTAQKGKALDTFMTMLTKYPDLGAALSTEGLEAIRNGQMPPAEDLAKVYSAYKDTLAGQKLASQASGMKWTRIGSTTDAYGNVVPQYGWVNAQGQQVSNTSASATPDIPAPQDTSAGTQFSGSEISGAVKDGANGGQCGEFIHNFIEDYSYGLNTIEQKESIINVDKSQTPQVGDVVIERMDSGPAKNVGHVAIVNSVNEDGTITLTESNYHMDERVDNTRKISVNDPKISGYFRGKIKDSLQTAQKQSQTGSKQTWGQYLKAAQDKAGQSFDLPKREQLRQEYDSIMGQQQAQTPTQALSPTQILTNPNVNDSVLKAHPEVSTMIKAIAEGRQPPPAARGSKMSPILNWVNQYDPTFSADRYDYRKSFDTGNISKNILLGNTGIKHLAMAYKAMEDLQPTDKQAVEGIIKEANDSGIWTKKQYEVQNWLQGQKMNPKYNKLIMDLFSASDEMAGFYAAGAGNASPGEDDKATVRMSLSPAQSTADFGENIANAINLMMEKVGTVSDTYTGLMGAPPPSQRVILPQTQAVIDEMKGKGLNIINPLEQASGGDTVAVISPDGTPGTIPSSQLQEALAAGYKQQ